MKLVAIALALMSLIASRADAQLHYTEARKDSNGFLVHPVESEFQKGTTQIRVLLPDSLR